MTVDHNEYANLRHVSRYCLQADNEKYNEGNAKIIWLGIRINIDMDHLRVREAEQK